MRETSWVTKVLKPRLRKEFPGCIILKNDANQTPGFPDIIVLYGYKYTILEAKKHAKATHRPLQDYYVDKTDEMSLAFFVYPENLEEVIEHMIQWFLYQ